MQYIYKIVENLDDHVGYNGEYVAIKETIEGNYFIVVNQAGKEWMVGEEEIEKHDNGVIR